MRKILFSLTALTLFILGIFVVIVFNSSPLDHQRSVIPMFFIFLFLSLFLVSLLISLAVLSKKKSRSSRPSVMKYIRRCAFFSLGTVGLVLLSAYDTLNLVSGTSFVLAVLLIDLFVENKLREGAGNE